MSNDRAYWYQLFSELKDCVDTYLNSVSELKKTIIRVKKGKASDGMVGEKINKVRRSRGKLIKILKKIESSANSNLDSNNEVIEDTVLLIYFIEMSTAKDEIYLLKRLSKMKSDVAIDNDLEEITELRNIAIRISSIMELKK